MLLPDSKAHVLEAATSIPDECNMPPGHTWRQCSSSRRRLKHFAISAFKSFARFKNS